MKERRRETERQKKTDRERPEIFRGVDIVATNVTTATVPKLGVTMSRPTFDEKRGKGRGRQKARERERERREER